MRRSEGHLYSITSSAAVSGHFEAERFGGL
jgi:hypothetical protein